MSASGRAPASYSARTSMSDRHVGWRSRTARHPSATAAVTVPSPDVGRPRDGFAAGPSCRLVEQRVFVEVGIGAQPVHRRAVPEDRPDRWLEEVGQVEVDGPDGAVEVDLLVHEPPGTEEDLERAEARFVERQPALGDERVAPQPLDIHRPDRDARDVGVATDVVQVVDGEDAREQRLEPADPPRHGAVDEGRLRDQERHPGRVDRLVIGEGVALGDVTRRPPQAAQERAQLAFDDPSREVLVGQPLAGGPARILRRREGREHLLVEEVRERAVSDVVHEPGHPQRLDDEALRRDGLTGAGEFATEARVERPRPSPGLVHDAKAVGEPRVLGRREDPPGALELADPAQTLDPRGVEDVLLGDVLVGQPERRRLVAGEALGEFDVPVDRVADQVDRRELVTFHAVVPA